MEPKQTDETPTAKDQAESRPVRKSYAPPKVTPHGKLPPLTLASSATDED
jgi:hypothetical protein